MDDQYAYISPDFDEIINDIRKESIMRFFFIMDQTMGTDPKTQEEFLMKYSYIKEMLSEEAEKIIEYDAVKNISHKRIKLSEDKLYYIEHDDCSMAVIEIAKKIYLKACGALVKKGILEPMFDAKQNDFVFRLSDQFRENDD